MKTSLIALLGAATLAAHSAFGSVTITTGAVGALNNNLGAMISLGSVGILVADTDGNGLANAYNTTLAAGSTLGNTGSDLIVGVYQAIDLNSNQNGFDLSATVLTYSGAFGAGDSLYILWFPSISSVGATVAANATYGAFRTDNIDALGTMAWTAPADGTNQKLFSLGSSLGGNPAVAPIEFTATFTAVPEPSTYGLVGIALLGLIFLRRRELRLQRVRAI